MKPFNEKCEKLKIDRSDFRFSRKTVRAWTAWSDSTLKRHLARLEDLEYLVVHRGGPGQSFVYELIFVPGENASKPRLPGLIHVYDLKKSGVNVEKSAPSPRQVTGVSGGVHLPKPAPVLDRSSSRTASRVTCSRMPATSYTTFVLRNHSMSWICRRCNFRHDIVSQN